MFANSFAYHILSFCYFTWISRGLRFIWKQLFKSRIFGWVRTWKCRISLLKQTTTIIRQSSKFSQFINFLVEVFSRITLQINTDGILKWRPVLEAAGIVIIVFMPVLKVRGWALLIPVLFLIRLCNRKNPKNPLKVESLVLWLALLFSAIFSRGILNSGWIELAHYGIWLMVFGLAGEFSPEYSRRLILFLVYSSLIWISIGLMQQWAGVPTPSGWLSENQGHIIMIRIYSLFINPNIYGLYLLTNLILVTFLLKNSTGYRQLFLLLILVLTVISLYLTFSRIAWILTVILSIINYWSEPAGRKRLLLGVALLIPLAFEGLKARSLPLLHLNDSSFRYRLRVWEGAINTIKEYWLWGAGPGSFSMVYPWYQRILTAGAHAHQLYLQLWLENGIVSLGVFLFWVRCFFQKVRRAQGLGRSCMLIVIVFLSYGLTESWFQSQLITGYFWLFAGLTVSLEFPQK